MINWSLIFPSTTKKAGKFKMANLQGQFSSKEGGSCYKKAPSVLLNTLIDLDTQNKARAKFETEDLNCSAF